MMRIYLLGVFLILCNALLADDPGITKVRLIQETDTSYILEIDISQSLLWAIKAPVLPERFRLTDPVYENKSGWITLKTRISTDGEPFSPKDEILLPWLRNGVDITVQWKDGKTYKGLFNRALNGIHIPLRELMPVQKTTREVLRESFLMGIHHLIFRAIHLLLIIVLVWAFPSFKVFRFLIAFTLGQFVAMILVGQLGIKGFDLLLTDLLLVLIIFLISYSVVYKIRFKYLALLLFVTGAMQGLSIVHEISIIEMQPVQRIQALFAFSVGLDLGLYLFAPVLVFAIPFLQKHFHSTKWFTIVIGSISIFLVLLIFRENIFADKREILDIQKSQVATTYKSPSQSPGLSARRVQRGKGLMTTPVMVYLSVEPFEIRAEVLIQAAPAMRYLKFHKKNKTGIPVESQEEIKKELEKAVISATSCVVNNKPVLPADLIINFVNLGRGGVATRDTPVEENPENAILGITLIYDIESYPDSIMLTWNLFPDTVQFIEASAVDPHGAFTIMLTPDENTLKWKSRLVGYQIPVIEAIEFERQPQPLVSFILWIVILVWVIVQMVYQRRINYRQWILILVFLGFITYPFVQFQVNLPFIPYGKPSAERGNIIINDLLTNVYRAFDKRNENDVYDRLALSVSEDQLSEIYMQNRQSMALENRGGARANVDDVSIQELYEINRSERGGYVVDVKWTVRGSVNHFGHTHYRQNQYRALVSFGIDDECWKINHIDILNAKRLY